MVTNTRIADLVRDNTPEGIPEAIEEGAFFDMQSFTQALIAHVLSGEVDREVAANAATNRHDFLVSLEHALKRQAAEQRQAQAQAEAAEPEPVAPASPPIEEQPLPNLRVAGQ
jgi:Tfp pilus assembly ATPase PilU